MMTTSSNPQSTTTRSTAIGAKKKKKNTKSDGASLASGQAGSSHMACDCPICLMPTLDTVKTQCGHSFCFMCLFHPAVACCPICRAAVSVERNDFELDTWADLCATIFHGDDIKRRRSLATRFSAKFGPPVAIVAACRAAIKAAPTTRRADGRLAAEVDFREAVAQGHTSKSIDGSVAAQEMTFVNGFMRRRAPSIVVLAARSTTDDDDLQQVSPRARNGSCGVVVRRHPWELSPRAQTTTPFMIDLDADGCELAMDAAILRGGQPDGDDNEDPFATPRLRQQGVLHARPSVNVALPRLPSADTRLNQEMRMIIKRQSIAACARR
jgi:hypothetical protein